MAYLETDGAVNLGGTNDGFGGSNGWWVIILFALIFGWGRNGYGQGGYGGDGVFNNYTLGSDFSMLSRQISDTTAMTERKLDGLANGLCDGFYTNAQLINGVNTNIMQSTNAIQSQLADCCCKTQTNIKDVQYAIGQGFSETNYNMAKNTCDIIQAGHNDTQRIVDLLNAQTLEAKNEKIAEQQAYINQLQLKASQEAQTNTIINAVNRTPIASYVVPNPYCNCNNGCGGCM